MRMIMIILYVVTIFPYFRHRSSSSKRNNKNNSEGIDSITVLLASHYYYCYYYYLRVMAKTVILPTRTPVPVTAAVVYVPVCSSRHLASR